MKRRVQYGSSGELEVFAATRYFDGVTNLAAAPVAVRQQAEDLIQVKVVHHQEQEGDRSTQDLGVKTKSNLTTFVSPVASFRKNPPASSSTTSGIHHHHAASSADACGRDLGEVLGDRRLQGDWVVRRAGGDEERWVVRCGRHALEEQHHVVHEKIAGAKSSDDHQVEKVEDDHAKIIVGAKLSDGHQVEDGDDWGSDTSSGLFELDLEHVNNS
ncbi:hypothetical protein ZWY2020_059939 [Hordeum vulgare]|uniref:Uncharacterized protein n=1 Tax=Hordeum vulgare subsp. vulgare TaxID=112509 RepID=A0A8I6Y3V0_HORVV|nr:hypothetical protein ZWY2020_059939 [Hordeum vulgare]